MICKIIKTKQGNVAWVQGSKNPSPEAQAKLEALIDAATKDFKERNGENDT